MVEGKFDTISSDTLAEFVLQWVGKTQAHLDEGSRQNQKQALLLAKTLSTLYMFAHRKGFLTETMELETMGEYMEALRADQLRIEEAGWRLLLLRVRLFLQIVLRIPLSGKAWVWYHLTVCIEEPEFMKALLGMFKIVAESDDNTQPGKVPDQRTLSRAATKLWIGMLQTKAAS